MDGILFALYLCASHLPANTSRSKMWQFSVSLLFTRREAVIGCSPPVIRAKTSAQVDQPDEHREALNASVDGLIRRTGRDPSGLVQPVWMEQIYKVTRLTCCVRPLLVVHMADCHFLCVRGWRGHSRVGTCTAAATAFQASRAGRAQVCSAVSHLKWKIIAQEAAMAWRLKKEVTIRTDAAGCQLDCAIVTFLLIV